MMTVLTVIQVLLAIAMTGIILVQRGPGASAGSGFGAGASATVFGSRGSSSFLTRATGILATTFFVISMVMAVMVSRTVVAEEDVDLGVMEGARQVEQTTSDVPTMGSLDEEPVDVPAPAATETDVPAGPVEPVRDTATDDDTPEG